MHVTKLLRKIRTSRGGGSDRGQRPEDRRADLPLLLAHLQQIGVLGHGGHLVIGLENQGDAEVLLVAVFVDGVQQEGELLGREGQLAFCAEGVVLAFHLKLKVAVLLIPLKGAFDGLAVGSDFDFGNVVLLGLLGDQIGEVNRFIGSGELDGDLVQLIPGGAEGGGETNALAVGLEGGVQTNQSLVGLADKTDKYKIPCSFPWFFRRSNDLRFNDRNICKGKGLFSSSAGGEGGKLAYSGRFFCRNVSHCHYR